jgi:hypothetical protein
MKEDEPTDDIVVLEGHVPGECSEEIQIDSNNDEDHQYYKNSRRECSFSHSVMSLASKKNRSDY